MSWSRFTSYALNMPELGFLLDISKMNFDEQFLESMEADMAAAFAAMQALEKGAIANPDEQRQVGHYWLRKPSLAPSPEIQQAIEATQQSIKTFVTTIHEGSVKGEAGPFDHLVVIGVGGSALGPQFVSQALHDIQGRKLTVSFLDNTDPDGFDTVLAERKGRLGTTLSVVISKSGGTPETRNAMLEVQAAYERDGYTFARHALAVTQEGSQLDQYAEQHGWLKRFPMWDWVGGRTSEFSAVGLLPAALEGIDTDGLLHGAAEMDSLTRCPDTRRNPATLLALMWYYATEGRGSKAMVVLPYKDRLALFSRYLQQLVMESLGKKYTIDGEAVHQGIVVYGHKGSTDQHAYIQQLREGPINFFATFIAVLRDRKGPSMDIEPGETAGDTLYGLLLGTSEALHEQDRESIILSMEAVTPESIGALIALYERAVGLYASLIGINAYHQPGVEAGKKAATRFLALGKQLYQALSERPGQRFTAEALAAALEIEGQTDVIYKLLLHYSANPEKHICRETAPDVSQTSFYYSQP